MNHGQIQRQTIATFETEVKENKGLTKNNNKPEYPNTEVWIQRCNVPVVRTPKEKKERKRRSIRKNNKGQFPLHSDTTAEIQGAQKMP